MIPKIIHFCWFGGNPLPPLALKCIASWRKYLPEYEIWMWVEKDLSSVLSNREGGFDRVMGFDVNIIPYTAEAYKQKKYAFVSDYARFWIMHEYGGLYFDTDVEVIRPLDDIIAHGNFMGFEIDPDGVNTPGKFASRYCFDVALGLGFGMETHHFFMRKMMDYYNDMHFELPPDKIIWYKTIVAHTTDVLCEMGLKNIPGIQRVDDITIYPSEYFAPIKTVSGRMHKTENTRSIHWYMGSWSNGPKSPMERLRSLIPEFVFVLNNKIKRHFYRIR